MSATDEARGAGNPIGVVQGRLLGASVGDSEGKWQDEFYLASRLGLDGIELIFDGDAASHPLMTDPGLDMVRRISAETGVRVLSLFASYFRRFPLHKESSDTDSIIPVLRHLIPRCRKLGASQLVLPCIARASIESTSQMLALRKALGACMSEAIASGVNISILSDQTPDKKLELMREFDSPAVSIAFETAAGNRVDPVKEINVYGPYISSVHVSDRMAGGEPAPLGGGSVELALICHKLKEQRYGGPFILSGTRPAGSDAVSSVSKDLAYLRKLIS